MKNLELGFSDKNITPWGGMVLMKKMLDHFGFIKNLEEPPLPKPGSNRGYYPVQLIQQFMISIWCGANRYEHYEVTRYDNILKRIFGFKKISGHRAISRLFAKFDQGLCEKVFNRCYKWFFKSLNINHITLDLDSTVITRYGKQQGATKRYNPKKKNNITDFLGNTLEKLRNINYSLIRADTGFSNNDFLINLEEKIPIMLLPYQ